MKPTPTRLLSRLALLSLLPCPQLADAEPAPQVWQVAQAGPGAVEADYWRSTEKLGTPDAYRAYLAAFPQGFYARLAHAALAKAGAATPPPAPSPVVAPQAAPPFVQHQVRSTELDAVPVPGFPDAAALKRVLADADSSSLPFRAGDVFIGPGPITVGGLGSRKQIVVPTGRWVVLAAEDGYSNHRTPVQMAAVAFGLFEGRAVRSVVTAAFDRRPGPAQWPVWSWDEAQRCEASGNGARFHWRFTAGLVKECVLVTNFSTLGRRGHWKGDIWESVRDNLGKLGVAVHGGRGLLSEFHLTDNRSGYLHVSRYDFDAPGLAGADGEVPIDLRLEARIQWAQEYAALAASGLARSIDADDLQPGGRAPTGTLRLPR